MLSHSDNIDAIAAALAKAQGEMGNAGKDATNPAFRSQYATLASVRDTVIPPLARHEIACVQAPSTTAEGVLVETRLVHSSGQWMACTMGAAPKDYSAQSIGSTVTYLRRYGLMALAGIAPEDDDGNAAGGGPGPRAPAPAARREPRSEPRQEPQGAAGHHPSWASDRARFCASLAEQKLPPYDVVAEWLEAIGKPRPSAMDPEQRRACFQAITGPKRADLEAFARRGAS